jgi:hypothetical protein
MNQQASSNGIGYLCSVKKYLNIASIYDEEVATREV